MNARTRNRRPDASSTGATTSAPDEFANLADGEATEAIGRFLQARIGAAAASEMKVLVASLLDADSRVTRLAGSPTALTERLNLETRVQDLRAVAHRHVLDTPMLTSGAVAEALGAAGANPRQAASGARRDGRLLGLPDGNTYVFPAFQFDRRARRIHPVVERVNRLLDARTDPWGVASWWLTPTPRLRGQTPADLVGTDREADLEVLAGAERGE